LSPALKVSAAPLFVHPDGAEVVVLGAVLSILTAGLVAFVELPALSETEAVAVSPVPSLEIVLSAGQLVPMPDRASAHVQLTTTSLLYQPAALGLVVEAPLRLGGFLSMLIPVTLVLELLSALSTAVPDTD
jgi:hypothetical protein